MLICFYALLVLCSRCSYTILVYTLCTAPFIPYRVAISAQNNNPGEVNTAIVFSREGSKFMQISQAIDSITLPSG